MWFLFLIKFPLFCVFGFGCSRNDGEKVARFIRKLPAKITVCIHYHLHMYNYIYISKYVIIHTEFCLDFWSLIILINWPFRKGGLWPRNWQEGPFYGDDGGDDGDDGDDDGGDSSDIQLLCSDNIWQIYDVSREVGLKVYICPTRQFLARSYSISFCLHITTQLSDSSENLPRQDHFPPPMELNLNWICDTWVQNFQASKCVGVKEWQISVRPISSMVFVLFLFGHVQVAYCLFIILAARKVKKCDKRKRT